MVNLTSAGSKIHATVQSTKSLAQALTMDASGTQTINIALTLLLKVSDSGDFDGPGFALPLLLTKYIYVTASNLRHTYPIHSLLVEFSVFLCILLFLSLETRSPTEDCNNNFILTSTLSSQKQIAIQELMLKRASLRVPGESNRPPLVRDHVTLMTLDAMRSRMKLNARR